MKGLVSAWSRHDGHERQATCHRGRAALQACWHRVVLALLWPHSVQRRAAALPHHWVGVCPFLPRGCWWGGDMSFGSAHLVSWPLALGKGRCLEGKAGRSAGLGRTGQRSLPVDRALALLPPGCSAPSSARERTHQAQPLPLQNHVRRAEDKSNINCEIIFKCKFHANFPASLFFHIPTSIHLSTAVSNFSFPTLIW